MNISALMQEQRLNMLLRTTNIRIKAKNNYIEQLKSEGSKNDEIKKVEN